MPNTLTTFYTLRDWTKAKATKCNANFLAFRGDRIPINTDTASASHNTHDLGALDHYWKTSYANSINIRSATTTLDIVIAGDTAITAGVINFKFTATTYFSIYDTGVSSIFYGKRDNTTTAGNIIIGADFHVTSVSNFFINTTAATTVTSVNITTKGGLVEVGIFPVTWTGGTIASWGLIGWATTSTAGTTDSTTFGHLDWTINRLSSGVVSVSYNQQMIISKDINSTRKSGVGVGGDMPCQLIQILDHPPAGTYTYELTMREPQPTIMLTELHSIRMVAWEIF